MLPQVTMIIFAIHAAIKLGQKIRTVFEDEVRDGDLTLPPVGFSPAGLPFWEPEVKPFFEKEGRGFVAPPPKPGPGEETLPQPPAGLYYTLWQQRDKPDIQDQLCLAYQRIQDTLDPHRKDEDVKGDYLREPAKFYRGANALFVVKQWREGTDPKRPVWQRLAGTVVELALDYVQADPGLFGGNAKGDRIVRSFLLSLNNVDFAEARHDELLLEVLQASLNTFAGQADLVVSDDTLALLLKRVSATLVDQVDRAEKSNDAQKLLALYNFRREMLQDVLRVSAAAVSDRTSHLLGPPDSQEGQLLNAVLQAVLHTVQEQPQLFSSQTAVALYGAALEAVAQNAALILPGKAGQPSHEFLSQLFTGLGQLLVKAGQAGPPAPFTPDLARDVITLALDSLAQNARRLINPEDAQEQLLVQALERVILSFSGEFHHDQALPGIVAAAFSQKQLMAIIQVVFGAVAGHPQGLLPGTDNDPQRSALTQIMGAVAAVVSRDSQGLLTADGYVDLFAVALQAFAMNPDRLLNLNTADPMDNVMTQVMSSVLTAAAGNLQSKGRHLLWGEVLLQAMDAALGAVSKNTQGFLADPAVVTLVLNRLLDSASGAQANVLDAENLLGVFSPLLSRTLLEGRGILDEQDEQLIMRYLTRVAR
jgi:hypothetical protein